MDNDLSGKSGEKPVASIVALMERVHQASVLAEHSPKTEAAYSDWIYRFFTFYGRKDPADLGRAEVSAFLSYLATERRVSASSQHQARFALAFLYDKVLGKGDVEPRYKHLQADERMPQVLTRKEVIAVLNHVSKENQLMAAMIYGCGLRLKEVVGLRLRDIDFQKNTVTVHHPNGMRDRQLLLPRPLKAKLQQQAEEVAGKHSMNLQVEGFQGAVMPKRTSREADTFSKDLPMQFFFPSPKLYEVDAGCLIQRSMSESSLQKAVKASFKRAGLGDQGSCATLRHTFAAHLLECGLKVAFVQKLLGQKEIRYTKLYVKHLEQSPQGG